MTPTPEQVEALARALRRTMHSRADERDAVAILAALGGWTLVPRLDPESPDEWVPPAVWQGETLRYEAEIERLWIERSLIREMTGRDHPHDWVGVCGACEAYALLTRPPLLDLPDKPTEFDRVSTYRAALAHGLSDAEAREEGWPSAALAPESQP